MPAEIESTDFRVISLTKGFFALVDACDYERIARHKWQASVNSDGKVYAMRSSSRGCGKRKSIYMHREIIGVLGDHSQWVDHRNSAATLDNRGSNLRIATPAQNAANRTRNRTNTVGYKGVRGRSAAGTYDAVIKVEGRPIHLGTRSTPDAAHELYCEAARKHYGEFARFA